ncbi:class I adenylate-forming enzyme family protein [Novosphingobium bradum]|uniref:Class I adenylate-forming enzyme family protein n=1 Tax=Novosphingobium bradum TaxID=1737444 RepID=A0ABV7IM15_9SPHN
MNEAQAAAQPSDMLARDTMAALLRHQARLGDKSLVVVDTKRLSYADADRRSRKLASGLAAGGIGRGSRVAMLFGNGPDFAVCFLALARIGALAMPISTLSTPIEIGGMLRNADAEFFLSTPSYRGKDFGAIVARALGTEDIAGDLLLADLPVLRRVWIGIEGPEAAGDADDPRVVALEAQVSPADPLVVIHTSGSTSAPKGVTHTHGQVLRNMARQNLRRDYTEKECLLSNSPWFWIGGLAFGFIATLTAGARLLCTSLPPAEALDLIEAEQPTMTNGVASTVLALAKDPSFAGRNLSSMRRGNLYPIMPPDVRPADPELRYNLLGMTETGSVYLLGGHEQDLPEAKRGSFGSAVEGVETRIVDPETGLDGPAGEMWVRGANVMQGYYGRERHEAFDDDGWFHTGDMMAVDADGDFYFKGRTGDIIRTSGAQVSPREVEGAISEAASGRMSIVIGIPDPERDNLVTAVMVGDEPVDGDALRLALKARLAPYKIPRKWVQMAEKDLPTMSSGKIDLRKLVEIVRDL